LTAAAAAAPRITPAALPFAAAVQGIDPAALRIAPALRRFAARESSSLAAAHCPLPQDCKNTKFHEKKQRPCQEKAGALSYRQIAQNAN